MGAALSDWANQPTQLPIEPLSDFFKEMESQYKQMTHEEMKLLYKQMMDGHPMEELCNSYTLEKIEESLISQKQRLYSSRTAKLWLQYMDLVDLLKKFVKAERLGIWPLHLQATMEMLPFFGATGHNNYLKSSHMYVQEMQDLTNSHPDIYHHFCNGLHVVRRSDRLWGGLSSDLIIEQCLMRNLKTSGGLTHGSGMSELQRNIWTLSMPACVKVHESMQEICQTMKETGEQNTDLGTSRVSRDWKDTQTVTEFLRERNPFEYRDTLCNIATGVHAQANVNADNAKQLGEVIMQRMVGANISQFSFKRKDQAVTLASKHAVKVDGEAIQIDPQLLFQRLTVAGNSDLESALKYELCSYPPALFESPELLNEAQKSTLTEFIWSNFNIEAIQAPKQVKYVIDGGALLHRIPWVRGSSFLNIITKYTEYVKKRYGEAVVVFDGYSSMSTKDMTHIR